MRHGNCWICTSFFSRAVHWMTVNKLKRYGCTKIFKEKRSGATADRPQLTQSRDYVRDGDTLIITIHISIDISY